MFLNQSRKLFWFLAVTVLSFTPSFFARGQSRDVYPGEPSSKVVKIPNPLGETNTLAAFIGKILDVVFNIGSVIAVFFIIYSGFLMVTAGANEEKLSKARQAFLWTVIGVAILLGAKVLSAVICGTINQLSTTRLSCPS